jgi:hypothetical protein
MVCVKMINKGIGHKNIFNVLWKILTVFLSKAEAIYVKQFHLLMMSVGM